LLFRARLRLELRPGDIPAGQEGLARLTLAMMDRGMAGHLQPGAFERVLDEAGIRIQRRLSTDAITWDVVCRNRDQDRALGLLADAIIRPVMDPGRLPSEALACTQAAAQEAATPEGRLRVALGLNGPPQPTEASLKRLGFAQVEAFRGRVFRPDRAALALEGDLGLEQAKALAILSFGTWTTPSPAPAAPVAPLPAPHSTEPARISGTLEVPRAEVAAPLPQDLAPALRDLVLFRLAGDPPLASRWLPPTEEFTLRFRAIPAPGSSPGQALDDLRRTLASISATPPSATDLDRIKAAWAGSRQVETLHPAARIQEEVRELLGEAARPEAVAAVTPEQLQAALQRWLAPAVLTCALVEPGRPTP
jgi:predicted Zn-dependent peptidase